MVVNGSGGAGRRRGASAAWQPGAAPQRLAQPVLAQFVPLCLERLDLVLPFPLCDGIQFCPERVPLADLRQGGLGLVAFDPRLGDHLRGADLLRRGAVDGVSEAHDPPPSRSARRVRRAGA